MKGVYKLILKNISKTITFKQNDEYSEQTKDSHPFSENHPVIGEILIFFLYHEYFELQYHIDRPHENRSDKMKSGFLSHYYEKFQAI